MYTCINNSSYLEDANANYNAKTIGKTRDLKTTLKILRSTSKVADIQCHTVQLGVVQLLLALSLMPNFPTTSKNNAT